MRAIVDKCRPWAKGRLFPSVRSLFWSIVLGGAVVLGGPGPAAAKASVVNAASPALADVKAAIGSVPAGGSVLVPAGAATWSGPLVISKGIQLIGAGIGRTVITADYNLPAPNDLDGSNFLILYSPSNPASNDVLRVSGFTLNLNRKCFGIGLFNATITPVNKVRLDHNRIVGAYTTGPAGDGLLFLVFGSVYGVADHNELVNGMTRFQGLDEKSWNNFVFNFGSADNFYVEDNHFSSPDTLFFYGEAGSRYCARFNSFDSVGSTNGMYPFADLHGNQPDAHMAEMGAEIYGNVIDGGAYGVDLIDHRGGKALLYNNTVVSSASSGSVFIQVREEYNDNVDAPTYPAKSPLNGQPQHVSDSYYWNNRHEDSLLRPWISQTVDYGGSVGIVPQANRDFWSQGPSFDGTSGVGVGLKADRPSTCTTGVGYWATDETLLYKATATNTWTAYYRPYTYPHPLTWPLNLTSPNGGESWTRGSTHPITWLAMGYTGTVALYLLRDGAKVLDIGTAPSSAGSFTWTVPAALAESNAYTVMITGGSYQDVSEAPFHIGAPPSINLAPSSLIFAATVLRRVLTGKVAVSNAGGGNLNWTAVSSRPWLTVSPASGAGDATLTLSVDPTGLTAGVYSGSIAVSDPNDPDSPRYIMTTLWMPFVFRNPAMKPGL